MWIAEKRDWNERFLNCSDFLPVGKASLETLEKSGPNQPQWCVMCIGSSRVFSK